MSSDADDVKFSIIAIISFSVAFSVMVFITGDAAFFLSLNVIGTIITVLVKGTVAGLCAGLVYKLLVKFNNYLAVLVAAIVCPIVNTGIFLIGCSIFFFKDVSSWASAEGMPVGAYMTNQLEC